LFCDHRHSRFGKPAAGFLAEVLRVWRIFLALLSASGTCARRTGRRTRSGAAGRRRGGNATKARGRIAGISPKRQQYLAGMAGRKDCLVATRDWGSQQSA